ncbi:hypothetical protein ACNHYB_15715 [Isoptericola jiangsuensis]|uniref:hypothetical protein n=1 Tax=Isoptericola jiangsuensis TaxID=548579 RepID=UPI003AB014BD
MLQRILGVVLVLAGLVGIAFGVASATVLKESDTVVATARPAGDGTLVVTDPGVLGMVAADVTVTATVPAGQQVTLVVGRDVDVLGWIGDDPYSRVTGMTDWETLSSEAVTAPEDPEAEDAEAEDAEAEDAEEPATPEVLDPSGSDMWVSELTRAEEVSLRWTDQSGPWVVMAAGTGAAPVEDEAAEDAEADADAEAEAADAEAEPVVPVAPTLQLTWNRDVGTPLLWPSVGVGAALLLVGLALLASSRRRRRAAAAASSSASASSPASAPVSPSSSPFSASSARSGDDAPAARSPFAATSASTAAWSPAAPAPAPSGDADQVTPTAGAPAVADPGTGASPSPSPDNGTDTGTGAGGGSASDPAGEQGSGTAPVPVAGRFSRRSLLGRGRGQGDPEPAEQSGEQPDRPSTPGDAPVDPVAGTSSDAAQERPLTRRELRRREEERRAAEPNGVGRAFRALTGQTPVVPAPPQDEPGTPGTSTGTPPASRRGAAWRETWGFDASRTDASRTDENTDEGNR